jgi:membrane-bound lytic murein transglycosylase MltF
MRPTAPIGVLIVLAGGFAACRGNQETARPAAAPPASAAAAPATPAPPPEEDLPPSELETSLPPVVRAAVLKKSTGDFDEMIERRLIRIGLTPSRTFYFVDKGVQRGVAYDYGLLMEDRINTKLGNKNIKVHVLFVPMPRAKLVPALLDGTVDMVAAHMTITPEREALVDFTDPTRTGVDEIIVTGPDSPKMNAVDDLSGHIVFARKSSNYSESLKNLNEKLKAAGKEPVTIEAAPEDLEDDDMLEMVNAGLIPAVVVDDYLAKFWKKVFPNLQLHENAAVKAGGSLGVAVRKNNPQLREKLNTFMGKYGLGTAFGRQVERKYLEDTTYVKRAASEAERKKFLAVVALFRKYSAQYSMDFLLMAAQGYQESRLDQSAKSHVGAIGIMQLMPATGAEMKTGDITQIEPNIHAGVKYMHTVMDDNFKDEPMDGLNKGLFTFAAYNAGPGRVRSLRREAQKRGLDPNVWFGNVETIASERIGRETVTYVSNIYKYYVAYRLVVEENERRDAAKASLKAASGKKQ